MSAGHTLGRIVVGEAREFSCNLLADGRTIARITYDIQQDPKQKANARRLAACWNACEGVETDVIEHVMVNTGPLLANKLAECDVLRQQIDTLQRELNSAKLSIERANERWYAAGAERDAASTALAVDRALLTEINRDTMSVLAFGMHARIDAFLAGGGA